MDTDRAVIGILLLLVGAAFWAALIGLLWLIVMFRRNRDDEVVIFEVEGIKVCRSCATVTMLDRGRCKTCNDSTWGYVPIEMANRVSIKTLESAEGPIKLVGYRSEDWPPRDRIMGLEEIRSIPQRDPELATALAVIPCMVGLWGIGHMYVGEWRKGLLLMLAGLSVMALFAATIVFWQERALIYPLAIIGLGVSGWQMTRAYGLALARNRLRAQRWRALRDLVGEKARLSEYDPGRL